MCDCASATSGRLPLSSARQRGSSGVGDRGKDLLPQLPDPMLAGRDGYRTLPDSSPKAKALHLYYDGETGDWVGGAEYTPESAGPPGGRRDRRPSPHAGRPINYLFSRGTQGIG